MNQELADCHRTDKQAENQQWLSPFSADFNRQGLCHTSKRITQSIKPLLKSAHVPFTVSDLTLFSLHEHTINLINNAKQLITLHRYGHGLSPMGWVLKSAQFDLIKQTLTQRHKPIEQLATGDLIIGHIQISAKTHICSLQLLPYPLTNYDKNGVAQLFKQIDNPTGLFGELRQNITEERAPELCQFCDKIDALLNGYSDDITPFIGLGAGLTPSFDDILIGMIAVLLSDQRFYRRCNLLQRAILKLDLDSLTTTISATFLRHALQGRFSLQVLQVITALNQQKYQHRSLAEISNYGHTSGADLLLGIWLGIDRFVIRD